VRIAYLVSFYPLPSHTFIAREVAALRRLGFDIVPCTIHEGVCLSPADRAEAARTFAVLPWPSPTPGRPEHLPRLVTLARALPCLPALAWSVLLTLVRRPGRWLDALRATMRLRPPGIVGTAKSLAYFVEAMRLAVELEARGVTHLHNHFGNPASHAGLAAARYLDIGWSLTLHGLGDWEGPTTPSLGQKVAAARFVASVTWYGRAQTMGLTDPAHWHKIHVVRCGIAVEELPRPARSTPGRGERLRILSVGRLSPEKGQVGLVEAFARSVERGTDAQLVIVGGGPEEERIRSTAARLGVGDRLELRGHQPVEVVLDEMSRAHLFVLSSFMEGLPVAIMEALALELPVVAPAITGIPELVIHGETGLLFTAGRWDELADRITALARDPALRTRLGVAGRARVMAEFDVARAVEPLAALFARSHAPEAAPARASGPARDPPEPRRAAEGR
jgi:glycosyltransferase involved in cell wall biosynthesis